MAHVIIDTCKKDGYCLDVCPTGAIRPEADDAAYAAVKQLYINPSECINCGACAEACPEGAIYAAKRLPKDKSEFIAVNYRYFLD